ncbi:nuclease domain-containing protein [Vibrio breoganii]
MSSAVFEVKYIETRWHDKVTLVDVVESKYSLQIDDISNDRFEAYTTIYPNVADLRRSQVAVAYRDRRFTSPPVIIAADGTPIPLKKIVHPETGKIWWIEQGEWNPQNKAWLTNTHRTAGSIYFRIGKQSLHLHITLSGSSKEELDKYLVDFKSDMWELVLDESSYIQGDAKQGTAGSVDETTLQLVDSILNAARNVLKQPKSELREIQTLKPRQAVKPVPRTFMEIATKGNSRLFTSRGTNPNFNVSENSYVLYVLMATQRIVSQLCRVSLSKTERFKNDLKKLDERFDSLKDHKVVNRDLVVKDYKRAKREQDVNYINGELAARLSHINSSKPHRGKVLYIRIENENNWDGNFCKVKFNANEEWCSYPGFRYSSIDLNGPYKELFKPHTEYKLLAEFATTEFGPGVKLTPVYIARIEVINQPRWLQYRKDRFKAMEQMAISLGNSGWKKQLTKQELDEQNKERISIETRKRFYTQHLLNVTYVQEYLGPKEKQLRNLVKGLTSLGIKPKSTFPNSMTFVQNPSYQTVHASYKKFREQVGLTDEDILMALEEVDSIGLVNIPLLYERWCLLQLIKSLTHSFRFVAEEGWKRKLLKVLAGSDSANEAISFSNTNSKRRVALSYEPRLANGRTPDFVLDMAFVSKVGVESSKRVVLDAKFYSQAFMDQRGGLSGVVEELALKKDYSEEGQNQVFVLHPTNEALSDQGGPVSPQTWGEVSYLGELGLFEWEQRITPHRYGAVCLNPLISHQHSDEIQRLMGMFLQYETTATRGNDDVENPNMCIGCGSSSLRMVEHSQKNRRKVWYQCNECDLFTVYNHCGTCGHRLIKNGEYWTYHATMPLQPINIKCPKCEAPV